jgi:hypothetical protein
VSRAPDPIRLIIAITVLALIGIKVHFWFQGDARARTWVRGSSTIAGRVVDAEGRPIARAQVQIRSEGSVRSGGYAETDASGRFSVGELAAADFVVEARRSGHLPATYGEFAAGLGGSVITVADGAVQDGVTITMWRGGTMAGTVIDAEGKPNPYCAVSRRPATVDYQARGAGSQSARLESYVRPQTYTDPAGRFLLSEIPPGSYLLFASCNFPTFPGTFYPSARREADATPIAIQIGQERRGLELRLRTQPAMTSVAGSIRGPAGQPMVANVTLASDVHWVQTSSAATGRFSFAAVPQDDYWITVHAVSGSRHYWGRATVTTSARPTHDVNVVLQPGRSIMVTTTFESRHETAKPDRTSLMLAAADAETARWMAVLGFQHEASGDESTGFLFKDVPPGRYFLRVWADSPVDRRWTVDAAVHEGRDWLDLAVEVGAERDTMATVTLVDQPASVSGRVSGVPGQPDEPTWVVAFAEDPRLRASQNRTRIVRVGSDGHYFVGNLPTGGYLLAVARGVQVETWPDAALVDRLAAQAVSVTVARAEKKSVDLASR